MKDRFARLGPGGVACAAGQWVVQQSAAEQWVGSRWCSRVQLATVVQAGRNFYKAAPDMMSAAYTTCFTTFITIQTRPEDQ